VPVSTMGASEQDEVSSIEIERRNLLARVLKPDMGARVPELPDGSFSKRTPSSSPSEMMAADW